MKHAERSLLPSTVLLVSVIAAPGCPPGGGPGGGAATFAKSYGGLAHDRAASGIPLAGGGYLFAGTTNERVPGDSPAEGDLWVVELDALGDVRWGMAYGERLADPSALEIDYLVAREARDGGLWLGGHQERAAEPGGDYREDGGNIAIARLDATGQPVWPDPLVYDSGAFPDYDYARPDGTTDEKLLDIWPTGDGGLLTASWLTATVRLPGTMAVVEAHAVYVTKITADGFVAWSRKLHRDEEGRQFPNYFEEFRDSQARLVIRETHDGGAVVGISILETLGFAGYPGAEGLRLGLQVARLHPNGEVLWVRDHAHRFVTQIVQTDDDGDGESDDGFLLCGSVNVDFTSLEMLFRIRADGDDEWSFESTHVGIYQDVVERCFPVPGDAFRCTFAAVSLTSLSTFLGDGTVVDTVSKPNGSAILEHLVAEDRFLVYGRDEEEDQAYVRSYPFDLAAHDEFPHEGIDSCGELVERASFTRSGDLLVPCGDLYLDGVARRSVTGVELGFLPLDARFRARERAYAVLATASDGTGPVDGYTVLGTSASFQQGDRDRIWLVRVGLDGGIRWQRVYDQLLPGTARGAVDALGATADGGYVLGCRIEGELGVVHLDADGTDRGLTSPIAPSSLGALSSLDVIADGGCIVAGDGPDAAWLARLSTSGTVQWSLRYTPSDSEVGLAAGQVVAVADGFVLSGTSATQPWAMKVDPDGQVLWSFCYELGSLVSAGASSLAATPDGGLLLGTTVGAEDRLSGDGIDDYVESGRRNHYLIRLDGGGAALWYRIYGGLYDEVLHDVSVLEDGGFLVSGASESLGDFEEAWILRLGPDGLLSDGCNAYLGGGSLQPPSTAVPVFATAYTPARDLPLGGQQAIDTETFERALEDIVVARQCAGVANGDVDEPPPPVETFTLTLVSAGPGTGTVTSEPDGIVCGPFCEAEFEAGAEVYLLAEPDFNYAVRWLGCDEGVGDDGCLVTMHSDRTVYVNFVEPFATLRVEFAGGGSGRVVSEPEGIDCTSDCEAFFLQNSLVFLHPIPDEGSVFSHWEGCDPDGDFGLEGCQVTMDGDQTVIAHFE